MKLTVKNFGPIREAKDIEISPMTIFVGPSNTGKSYLAMLVYATVKFLAEEAQSINLSELFRESKTLLAIFRSLKKSEGDVLQEVDQYFLIWAQNISKRWRKELVRCFGEEGSTMIMDEKFSAQLCLYRDNIKLDLTVPDNSELSDCKKEEIYGAMKKSMNKFSNTMDNIGKKNNFDGNIIENFYMFFEESITELQKQLSLFLLDGDSDKMIEKILLSDAHYLPSVRGGIMQSQKALINSLIYQASMRRIRESAAGDTPLFNGVLADFMQKLIAVGEQERLPNERISQQSNSRIKDMKKISGEIEKSLLFGKIEIQRNETGYPDFRYNFGGNGDERDLPLMSASSSVSELAPIVLFIRHYLEQGSLFIVEEPEAHLHPGAQRDISNQLTQLVNAGVNVLITTHSDNILEQISNFIYRANIDGYGTKLELKNCSVYLFSKFARSKNKGTVVKKVKFDETTGYVTQDHLDVASELYNETVGLLNKTTGE